jgi:ribosomal protein S6--L-glutamate ligase
LSRKKLVIRDNSTLRAQYDSLQAGDVFVGRLCLKASEEATLLDLTERGVHLIPSGLAQLALHDLIDAISEYQKNSITQVVTKLDRRNAGMGIHLWQSAEDVFTQASLSNIPLPFVLQPYMVDSRDIRIIIIGDYIEAYERHNPFNFRNNLHHGGESKPCRLTENQLNLCRQVMDRGRFPYGHLDLLITREEESYLGEINLRGGIRGAEITPVDYQSKIDVMHQKLLEAND